MDLYPGIMSVPNASMCVNNRSICVERNSGCFHAALKRLISFLPASTRNYLDLPKSTCSDGNVHKTSKGHESEYNLVHSHNTNDDRSSNEYDNHYKDDNTDSKSITINDYIRQS